MNIYIYISFLHTHIPVWVYVYKYIDTDNHVVIARRKVGYGVEVSKGNNGGGKKLCFG